jgi:hypothetical protein
MLHILQWLYTYVVSDCSKCFICFFMRTLQICLFGCHICFTYMLQVFYLDVAYALQWLFKCFRFFCKCFRRMLHVFHLSPDVCCKMFYLDVSKVDRVFHPPRLSLPRLGVFSSSGADWASTAPSPSSRCSKCFSCFRRIFHMFHLNVAMTIHVCFKSILHVLQQSNECCRGDETLGWEKGRGRDRARWMMTA